MEQVDGVRGKGTWEGFVLKLNDVSMITTYMAAGSGQLPLYHLEWDKKQTLLENLKSLRLMRKVVNQLLFIILMMKQVDQVHLDPQNVLMFPNTMELWRVFFCLFF